MFSRAENKSQGYKEKMFFGLGSIALVLSLGFGFIGLANLSSASKSRMLQAFESTALQDVVYILLNSYSSLKKTADIIHFPYWFQDSKLETFYLEINPADIGQMNSALPGKKFVDALEKENRIFVPAIFTDGGYNTKVDVRYRGFGGVHWNNGQRSLLVKFPQENLFRGVIKSLDLIVPYRRNFILEVASVERARLAGIKARDIFLVRLNINGGDAGVYLAQERFSKEWLEVNGYPADSEVFEGGREESNASGFWRKGINEDSNDFGSLKALAFLVEKASDEEFRKNIGTILDLEAWYKGIAMRVLSGSAHSSQLGNFNLFLNSATGRFEPILEDISGGVWEEIAGDIKDIYAFFDPITKRVLSVPEFYNDYRNVLSGFLDEEVSKDLALYDSLYEEFRVEFYKEDRKSVCRERV